VAITLREPFRAVFYTPFYAALALDAYGAEGVDVRLDTASSPEMTAQGLLSGDIEMAWSGPMRILQVHDRDPDCGLVGFCEVVTRDPFFVVGREPRTDFDLRDLAELRIGTVSEVPTPWLCLQDDLRRVGVDPAVLDRVTDQTMAENTAALMAGELDAIQVFQPYAEQLVRDGAGHIWHAAASRGPTSYTTLVTTATTLASERDTALAMTRAIYRTLKWYHAQSAETIAVTVSSFFPDLEADVLIACIERYSRLGIYGHDPILPRGGFERLKGACLSAGFIQRGADYAHCVDTELARSAIEADPPSM
jgi:NitT/TauT family transport system substrate-binding protein